jgi:hypothetical protein
MTPGRHSAANTNSAHRAVERLVGPGGELTHSAKLANPDDSSTVLLKTRSGEEVTVTVRMAETVLPPGEDGLSPVARFRFDKETGQYIVEISPGAPRRHIERALAHEFSEIRAGHGRAESADVLTPGGRRISYKDGEPTPLSPHDEGRLAELAVLARQIKEARSPAEQQQLREDAEHLASELGLVDTSEAAKARRQRALLDLSPEARALLNDAVRDAQFNPFILRLSGEPVADLDTLRKTLTRIDGLGSPQDAQRWREQLIKVAAQALIDGRIVAMGRGGAFTNSIELARLLGVDPLAALGRGSPDPLVRLMYEASEVATRGLNSRTMSRSESRKVTPGFEAEFVDPAGKVVSKKQGVRPDKALTPTGPEIDRAVAARKALVAERDKLTTERANPKTSAARKAEIDLALADIEQSIRIHSETLGTAAGREFARQQLGGPTELQIPRAGAGVPDLLFETPPPQSKLIVVECKGGDSPLGTRESADRRFLVQQGTIEYLQSLARTMESSSDPRIRALGERLKTELAKNPPNVDYYVVRQPLTESGDLSAPQVGKFDLTANKPR